MRCANKSNSDEFFRTEPAQVHGLLSLLNDEPMIVLVAGLPGSGKSYFAYRLATELGGEYISSDKMRAAMGAMGRYSAADKLAVYREMAEITSTMLAAHRTVVADATFYKQAVRDLFIELAKEKSVPLHLILVQAQESLIKERLQKPRKDSEADFAVYTQLRNQFEPIGMPHLVLQSTNSNVAAMLKEALQYLANDRK